MVPNRVTYHISWPGALFSLICFLTCSYSEMTCRDAEAAIKRCFMKKDVFKNFAKLKLRLWHRYFPVNFAKFLRTSFVIDHLWMAASLDV